MENETHECTACSCTYTDDEGGVQGYFGMLPMSFCPTCLSSIYDMMDQLNPKEWIGLDEYQIKGVLGLSESWVGEDCSIPDMIGFAKAIEAKLKEANGYEE